MPKVIRDKWDNKPVGYHDSVLKARRLLQDARESLTGYVGIDPGISGAVVAMSPIGFEAWRNFKIYNDIGNAIHVAVKTARVGPKAGVDVAIENVHSMPGQGVVSTFTFGKSAGWAEGFAKASGGELYSYTPQRWQGALRNYLRLGAHPIDWRWIAADITDEPMTYLKRKKDHNSADAFCILLAHVVCKKVEKKPCLP